MWVADLHIRNFRGVREGHVRLGKHTIVIGANNVGKTTLIEAVALLFGRDRLVRELTEHDFTGSSPEPTDRILLVATISGFNTENPNDHLDWFRDGRGIPKYLDLKTGDVHTTRDDERWMLCCQIAFQARFDRETLSVETARYFHDDDAGLDVFATDGHVGVPVKLLQRIGFFLVRASRTWDGVISFGSELFRRTVVAAEGQPASAVLAERDRLRNPDKPIEEDDRLRPLVKRIDADMSRFLPHGPRLRLNVTATDSKGVLDSVVAHFRFDDDPAAAAIPAARQGSGLISLQGLLLLLQLGRARIEAGEGFLMALEEPELHIPPASQGRLMRRIQALSRQTIITTHAPGVAATTDPTALLVLRNDSGQLSAEPLLKQSLKDDAPNWLRRFFLGGRQAVIAALMHESLLIPEGRSEYELLRAITCALELREGWDEGAGRAFGLDVGIVPTEDAKVVEIHDLLARLHGKLSCLVDGDAEGDRYAAGLRGHNAPPVCILRWPDGWAIEDAVGWILTADEVSVLPKLTTLDGPPASVADVVTLLRRKKANVIVYEVVAEAVAETGPCATRARELLSAMAAAVAGEATPRFAADPSGALVFVP